jgi:hypothetical protein
MQRLKGLAAGLPQSASSDSMQFEPSKKPPMDSLTIEDVADSLKMCLVDKGGYLTDVPSEKVGHFYAGDSYVIFCKYKVSCVHCIAMLLGLNMNE